MRSKWGEALVFVVLMSRLAALKNLVAGPLANVKAVCFLFPFRSQRN